MKIALVIVYIFIGSLVYSQSWTIQGDSNDSEVTVITLEQFENIIKGHQSIDRAVKLEYVDYSTFRYALSNAKIIRGSLPNFNGSFFLTYRIIPKTDAGYFLDKYQTASVVYGNTRTNGIMSVTFLNNDSFYNVISLTNNYNEYIRQYNQLVRLVNGND